MSHFFIASLKHTNRECEHIVWWGRFHCGYTPVLGEYVGAYCYGEARELNDGLDCLAVPVEVVRAIATPEPYYLCAGEMHRFYDQRGPVVENTRANWDLMIARRLLPEGPQHPPRPMALNRQRRAFAWNPGALQ